MPDTTYIHAAPGSVPWETEYRDMHKNLFERKQEAYEEAERGKENGEPTGCN